MKKQVAIVIAGLLTFVLLIWLVPCLIFPATPLCMSWQELWGGIGKRLALTFMVGPVSALFAVMLLMAWGKKLARKDWMVLLVFFAIGGAIYLFLKLVPCSISATSSFCDYSDKTVRNFEIAFILLCLICPVPLLLIKLFEVSTRRLRGIPPPGDKSSGKQL